MKKNSLFIFMVVPLFMFCQSVKPDTESVKNIEEIQVQAVDFFTFTIISVDCDKFEEYFSNITSKSITNSTVINEFLSHIDKFEPIDSTYSKQINTRAKIHMISKNDTTTICVGYLTLQMNDSLYRTPQFIIDFLEEIE